MKFERPERLPAAIGRARSLRRRMTSSEKLLWRELRKLDLNFRRQATIGRYVVDFAVLGRSLVVEDDPVACAEKVKALLLDGGGLGGGEEAEVKAWREWASAPDDAEPFDALGTPPSPALPPSRRKGA